MWAAASAMTSQESPCQGLVGLSRNYEVYQLLGVARSSLEKAYHEHCLQDKWSAKPEADSAEAERHFKVTKEIVKDHTIPPAQRAKHPARHPTGPPWSSGYDVSLTR